MLALCSILLRTYIMLNQHNQLTPHSEKKCIHSLPHHKCARTHTYTQLQHAHTYVIHFAVINLSHQPIYNLQVTRLTLRSFVFPMELATLSSSTDVGLHSLTSQLEAADNKSQARASLPLSEFHWEYYQIPPPKETLNITIHIATCS